MNPADDLARLRLKNDIGQACLLLQERLATGSSQPGLLEEMAKLGLLRGRLDWVLEAFQRLCARAEVRLGAEWVLRFQLFYQDAPILELADGRLTELDASIRWTQELIEANCDPVYAASIREDGAEGWHDYLQHRFELVCPSCGFQFPVRVRGSFVVLLAFHCVNCFANLELDGDAIVEYFSSDKRPLRLTEAHDALVFEAANRALACDSETPLAIRMLGGDYANLLSHLLARRE